MLAFAPITCLIVSLQDSSLKDITKPYVGEYECKKAQYGAQDILSIFSYIRLELKADDTFVLSYKQGDQKGKQEGAYHYEKEKNLLWFESENMHTVLRACPFDKGVLVVSLPIGEKQLCLQFARK